MFSFYGIMLSVLSVLFIAVIDVITAPEKINSTSAEVAHLLDHKNAFSPAGV